MQSRTPRISGSENAGNDNEPSAGVEPGTDANGIERAGDGGGERAAGLTVDPTLSDIAVDGIPGRDLLVTDPIEDFAPQAVLANVVLTTRPSREAFFRVHPDPRYTAMVYILRLKDSGDADGVYIVTPKSSIVHAAQLQGMIRPAQLFLCITRTGSLFLLAARIPGPDGRRDGWMDGMLAAVDLAKTKWVRLNSGDGGYKPWAAEVPIPEPEWPPVPFERILAIAAAGKVISSADHPVVLGLLGKA